MAILSKNKCDVYRSSDFPVIKKSVEKEYVVMFVSKNTGFVIYGSTEMPVGTYFTNWVDCSDNEYWGNFVGEIILKNA